MVVSSTMLKTVAEGVDKEKSMVFDKISLVEPDFEFFSFLKGAENCDMATVVLAFVDVLDVVDDIVGVSEGFCDMET